MPLPYTVQMKETAKRPNNSTWKCNLYTITIIILLWF